VSVIADVREQLANALRGVEGVRYYTDPAGIADPPASVLGPAELSWDAAGCSGPSAATFRVYVLHARDDRAAERLPDLAVLVAAAVDELPIAAVQRADPGVFTVGGQDLPSYEITVEVDL